MNAGIHHRVADPVRGENGWVVHLADSVANAPGMVGAAWGERHDAVLEDEDVDHSGWRQAGTLISGAGARDESLKGDQVVILEHVDFLARFPNCNVLCC